MSYDVPHAGNAMKFSWGIPMGSSCDFNEHRRGGGGGGSITCI